MSGTPQPFDSVKTILPKDSARSAYLMAQEIHWEKHINELKRLSIFASQAAEFVYKKNKTEGKTGIQKPDLIQSTKKSAPDTHLSVENSPNVSDLVRTVTSPRTSPRTSPLKAISEVVADESPSHSAKNQAAPKPVRENFTPKSVEKNAATPKSVGEKATPKPVAEKATPKSVGEKAALKSVEEKATPKSVGENSTPKSVGEKSAPKPVGEKTTPKSVEENSTPMSLDDSATSKPHDENSTPQPTTDGNRPRPKLVRSKGSLVKAKPPNILVYSDSLASRDCVIATLKDIVKADT